MSVKRRVNMLVDMLRGGGGGGGGQAAALSPSSSDPKRSVTSSTAAVVSSSAATSSPAFSSTATVVSSSATSPMTGKTGGGATTVGNSQTVNDKTKTKPVVRKTVKSTALVNDSDPLSQIQHLLEGNLQCHLPPHRPKLIRLFLASSSPSDFLLERECFWRDILPELQHHCLQYGAELVVIDPFQNAFDAAVATSDPYYVQTLVDEIYQCQRLSAAVFCMCFLGDKYGQSCLPTLIRPDEYSHIRTAAFEATKDVRLLDEWYKLDNNANPPSYKLVRSTNSKKKMDGKTLRSLLDVVQHGAHQAHKDGLINQVNQRQQDRFFSSLIEALVQAALLQKSATKGGIFAVFRKFTDVKMKPSDVNFASFIDLASDDKSGLVRPSERIGALKNTVSAGVDKQFTETFTATWPSTETTVKGWIESKQKEKYLGRFTEHVTQRAKQMITQRMAVVDTALENAPLLKAFDSRLAYDESAAHLNWAADNAAANFVGQTAVVGKVVEAAKALATKGAFVVVQGDDCSGKTALLCHLAAVLRDQLPRNAAIVPRFVGITAGACFAHELWRHLCIHVAMCYGVDPAVYQKAFTMGQLSQCLSICFEQVSRTRVPLVLLLDDVHLIKYGRSIGGCLADFISLPLPPNIMIVCTHSTASQQSTASTAPPVLPWVAAGGRQLTLNLTLGTMNDGEMLEIIKNALSDKHRRLTIEQQGLLKNKLGKLVCSPSIALILAQEATIWTSYFQGNNGDKSTAEDGLARALAIVIEGKLIKAEQEHGLAACAAVCQYLTVAPHGLTEIELLDVLSCNRGLLKAIEADLGSSQSLASFPINIWLPLRISLDVLLTEVIYNGRAILRWKHQAIISAVKYRYLQNVTDIKKCHSDLADLYNDVWSEMGPSISMEDYPKSISPEGTRLTTTKKPGVKSRAYNRRFSVFPQPLKMNATGEESLYNMRRVKNLWYHLLHAGNIDYLKEQAICNFLYLNAIMQSCGLTHLLTVMEDALQQVLHHDLQVLYDKVILPAMPSLANDRDQLGAEVIGRLRYSRAHNSHFLNSLVEQAMAWVDNYSRGPLVVPLTCWIKPPRISSVTSFRLKNWTSVKTVLQPTVNHQHLLVSGNQAGKGLIYMYHMPSQTMVKTFQGHTDRVTSLTLSSQGQFFVSTSLDKTVRTWDLIHGNCIRNMNTHSNKVFCSILTYDDRFVVTGAADSCAKIVSLETGEVVKTFRDHTGPVVSLILTSYSEFLITGAGDFEVKVWNLDSGQLTAKMGGLMAPVTCMTLTSNDAFLVVSCEDETLRVFSLCSSVELHELQGHEGKVHSLVAAEDDCQLFAGCSDGKICRYDLHTGEILEAQDCGTRKPVTQLKMTNDNYFLVSVSADTIHVWNVESRNAAHVAMENVQEQESSVSAVTLSRDQKYAACATQQGAVALWDLEVCQCVWTSTHNSRDAVACLQFNHDSTRLLTGNVAGVIVVWDMANGGVVRVFTEHTGGICWIQTTSDGSRVYSIDEKGTALIWHMDKTSDGDVEPIVTFRGAKTELRLCPNDRDLIGRAVDNNKEMRIWTVSSDLMITARAKVYHNDAITCTYLTTTGHCLVTGSLDQSLKVWNVQQGFLTQVLVGHNTPVTCCAAGDDERFVISAAADFQVVIWETSSGEQLHVIDKHAATVTGLAVTSDGSVALSADKQGWINVWDTESGRPLSTFCAYMPIMELRCSFDANRIVLQLADCSHLPILCLHNTPAGPLLAGGPPADALAPNRGRHQQRASVSSLGSELSKSSILHRHMAAASYSTVAASSGAPQAGSATNAGGTTSAAKAGGKIAARN